MLRYLLMLSLSSALLMASGGDSGGVIPDITFTWVGFAAFFDEDR